MSNKLLPYHSHYFTASTHWEVTNQRYEILDTKKKKIQFKRYFEAE